MSITMRYPIVVAIDDSEYSEIVLEHAFDQAARHEAVDLHVVTVVDDDETDLEPTKIWSSRVVVEALDGFSGKLHDWRTRVHVRCGKPAEEIANLAGEVDARMLVVGRFGMHGRRSVADRVIELAPCPLLVIGRAGGEVDMQQQCPACVTVRAESDGERWFCAEHSAPGRMRLSTIVPPTTATRGSFY